MTSEELSPGDGADIIPISALTREAAFRRFSELVRRSDPLPEQLRRALGRIPAEQAAARGGAGEEELAELVYDSDDDEGALAGVRAGVGGTRRLTFESGEVALEVEVTLRGRRSLVCQVVPAQPAALELRGGGGTRLCLEDVHGNFHVTGVQSGPLSLRCRLAGRPDAFSTTWVRV